MTRNLLWLSALLFLGAASDVLAAVDFPTATDRELSSDTPSDIALADFNGDGDLDIVVSMSAAGGAGTAGISVVLSNGSGGFIGDNPFNPGLGAHALAAGDLDGDMSVDLAVVGIFGSGSTPQVRLFLGSGAGAFTAATPSNILSATGFPSAIVVGNFNGDSNPDLAVADSSGGVLVYLGDGTIGTGSGFGAGQAISGSSQSPRDLILDDFDGDGDIDLATPSAVFLGAGDGTFSASASLGGGKSLAAGDVNRDGILDIIVALNVSGADVLDTWLGAGDGTFTFGTRSNLLTTAHIQVKIAVADMDADGMVDVVASDTAGNTILVLPGQGDGSFGTAQSFATPAFSGPVAIGDWNGDSLPDMAGAYGIVDAAGLSIFFQNQPGPISAAPGAFRLGSSSYAVSEAVGQVLISVVRTGSSVGATTVNYATSDDTATAAADYTATSGTLNFADGQVVATFPVTILDDTVFEGPGSESFTVTLSAATLGTPSSASVAIIENDIAPDPGTLQFSTATYSAAENAAGVTITVTRTGGSAGIATANYATANGSATATEDYTATSGTVTFADGSMTSQSFTITLLDDLVYEGDETVSLSLSNVTGATAGSPTSATLTITENEIRQPGTLAFSSSTYSVDEHLGPVTVSVTRTGGSDGQVTIQYVTSSGTATQNSDYTGTVGTLTFADGVTTQSFTVAIIDDTVFEGDEDFSVILLNPAGGGVLGTPSTATVTILENDPPPPLNDPPVAVNNNYDATEDTPLTIVAPGVLGNDTDANSDPLTAVLNIGPLNGGLTLNTNGSFTYTPDADFNGSDSFTYHANDGQADSNIATVAIAVAAANDAPLAADDNGSTAEDTAVTVNVLTNDSDVDGDTITVNAVTQGSNGSVTFTGTDVTYTPNANFNGSDSFTYTITDTALTATATVNITVGAANDAPIAVDDPASTSEDTPVTVLVLGNDSDPDSDTITVSAVSQGTNGAVTFTANNVTYTPNANFNGSDSFTYTITDSLLTATATVNVSVAAVNDAPLAADDPASTTEDTPVTVSVLGNDSDPDGDTITVSAVSQGTNGAVTFTANNVTYTPDANFNGSDSFTYTITDSLLTATATVNVSVAAANDAPLAVDDAANTPEDTAITVNVLANDSDPDGDGISVTAVTQATNGSVTFTGSNVTYTPNANFNGSDSFTYTITDGNLTATATVSISVGVVNDAPVAVNDSGSTAEDTAVTVNVLTNDSDPDGDTITVSTVTQGINGSVTFTGSNATYAPNADFNGSDSFSYTITDGALTATATVNITVAAVNDAPVAVNDSGSTTEDIALTVNVLANDSDVDGDGISVSAVGQGTSGSVTFTGTDVTYTPDANFNGSDSFTYTITDSLLTATATVNITVGAANDAPIAVDDPASTAEDTPVTVLVLANDSDPDGDTITVSAVTQATNGSVTFTGSDATYTPNADFNGSDSFTYTITDSLLTAAATVTVTVSAANDAPLAADDPATTTEDTPVTVNVLGNDSDPDGDTITVSAVSQGANGSVTFTGSDVTYTPGANFNGSDSFTYTITDSVLTATATVNVTVDAANDSPIAVNDASNTPEDTPVTVSVLSNDSDPDGDAISVSLVTQGANGSVSTNGTTVTYTPNTNFNGNDSFTYTITDGNLTATATVSITVGVVNDAPVAVNDSDSTAEDTAVTVNVLTNDSDPDGDTITVSTVTQGTNGAVTFTGSNATYAPNADFNGSDSFSYTITDGALTATATVNITVAAVNDAPVAVNDSGSTTEDIALTVNVLANDSDVDGDTITVSAVTQGGNGAVTFTGSNVTYTPNADFNGSDSFTYTITDNSLTATATVNITVSAANDAPIAVDDPANTNEDTPVTVIVLANDSDPDGDGISVSAVSQGTSGSITTNGTTVTYTPSADFNGNDSFTYTITDGILPATATVNVTVAAVNDAPIAVDDPANTSEDTAVTLNVLTNDSDVDGDTISISSVSQGTNGSVAFAGSNVTYTPNSDFNGSDSFTYTITDGSVPATATVTVTVAAVNDAPIAADDPASTSEDTPVTVSVLGNDSDPDGDTITVNGVSQGVNGSVTFTANNVTYTPSANFNGGDSFTYTITDGTASATATVNVTVGAINDAPLAVDDPASTSEDTPVTVSVLNNDSDPDGDAITISGVSQGADGSVTFTASSVTYIPSADFNGSDSFTYTITDTLLTATATVNVSVSAANDAPVAVNDVANTPEDTAITVLVLGNDTDPDGDPISVSGVSQGTSGTVTTDGTTVTYMPNSNFNGSDNFTYTITDSLLTATATVSISVGVVNDAPVAVNDSASTAEDTAVIVDVLGNDSDPDNDTISVSLVSQGTNGSVTFTGTDVTYTPNLNFNGSDSFTYTITDNNLTATASVSITVSAVNDAPVAVDDPATTDEDQTVIIDVLGNDSDVDGGPLSVSAVTQGANGQVTNNGNNLTYTPAPNFTGLDSFTYTVTDGTDFTTANVGVEVLAVNDVPVAVPDNASTIQEMSVTIDVLANDTDTDGDSLSLTVVTQGANGSVQILANEVSYTPNPNFTGIDTFDYTLTDGQSTASATVTVDVIPPPGGTFSFEFADYSVGEAGWEIGINVIRSGGTQGVVSVDYASVDGTATAGLDYDPSVGTLAFADGQASASITIPILDDSDFEGDEEFTMELSNVQGMALLGTPPIATITILEDDPQPTAGQLSLLTSSIDVGENAGFATLNVVRSGGSVGQVTVDYVTVGGTAIAGSDYDHTTGTVVYADGQMGNRQIQVAIIDDGLYEGNEEFTVSLLNAQGGAPLAAPTSAIVNITDDDAAPPAGAFELVAALHNTAEDSGNLIIEISRAGGSFGTVSVDYQSADGSATSPQDYTAVGGTVEFLDGEISHTISIPIIDDLDFEGDEDFTLSILNPLGGATLGSLTMTTATILDNESPPPAGVLQFSGSEYTVTEDGINALVTVTRTGGSFGAVSIDFATSDDSAIAGQDYQDTFGTLMFADGATSQMIVIPLLDDAVYEVTERLQIALTNPQGGVKLGIPAIANIVIQDDDPAPPSGALEFSAPQYSVIENSPIATVTVIRSGGSAGQVGVEYSSTGGTATPAADYVAVAGTLIFADGETIKTFDVSIVDDSRFEGDESIILSLSNASGGAGLGGQSTATLMIRDDDIRSPGAVHFSRQAQQLIEGGSITITIVREGGSDGQIAVELNSVDGTARAGSDYNALSAVLQFADGETSKSVTFSTINDAIVESTENLKLELSNPSGGTTVSIPADATITITDNDRATPPPRRKGGGSVGLWWLFCLTVLLWSRQRRTAAI